MKKAIFLTMMSLFTLQVIVAQTIETKPMNIIEPAAQHGLDVYMFPQTSDVSIKIFNSDGYIIMNESVSKYLPLQKRYNLKSLETGDYTFEAESDSWKMTQSFTKKESLVLFDDEGEEWTNFPEWVVIANNVIVPKQDSNHIQPKELGVFNKDGVEVYSFGMTKESIEKGVKFDLSQLAAGDYNIVLETRKRSFTKSFTKD